MSDERIKKLNALLRDEIAQILTKELEKDDEALITVTGADVSPTLEHATIRISVYPKNKTDKILKIINGHIYQIQQLLNRKLAMRPVPKIRFEIDKSEERASQIDQLLNKIPK